MQIDAIGIGMPKCGTSSLTAMLEQHPQIVWAKRKELFYFNKYRLDGTPNPAFDQPLTFYESHWPSNIASDQIRMEFSTNYAYDPLALEKIKSYYPNVKLILMIRNPMERCFSHYLYEKEFNRTIPEKFTFRKALDQFPFLLEMGQYASILDKILKDFPREQLHIVVFEEFKRDPQNSIKKTYRFLGIDANFQSQIAKVNESKKVRSSLIRALTEKPGKAKEWMVHNSELMNKVFNSFMKSKVYSSYQSLKHKLWDMNTEPLEKPMFDTSDYNYLLEFYRPEIVKLESKTGFPLEKLWIKNES